MKEKSTISSKKDGLSKKITFTGTLSTIDFEIMYRVKLKRICKGYSQQELSFLLGKNKEYIAAREHLESKRGYTFLDINKLAFILEYDCPSFMPVKATKHTTTYTGSEIRENGKIYHEASIKAGASSKLLFKLEEDDPAMIHFPADDEKELIKLKTFLTALCEIGYFSRERTSFEVFGCCSQTVPGYLNVRLVEQAVNHSIQQKKIRKVARREYVIYQNA